MGSHGVGLMQAPLQVDGNMMYLALQSKLQGSLILLIFCIVSEMWVMHRVCMTLHHLIYLLDKPVTTDSHRYVISVLIFYKFQQDLKPLQDAISKPQGNFKEVSLGLCYSPNPKLNSRVAQEIITMNITQHNIICVVCSLYTLT